MRRKPMKKLLSLVPAAIMMMGLLPTTASALSPKEASYITAREFDSSTGGIGGVAIARK